jgi:hypothetical protein
MLFCSPSTEKGRSSFFPWKGDEGAAHGRYPWQDEKNADATFAITKGWRK